MKLTIRQTELVLLLVRGASLIEAANKLGLSYQLAKNHLYNARKRIKVKTTYQLVATVAVVDYKRKKANNAI